jgi:transcription elongation factor GreA
MTTQQSTGTAKIGDLRDEFMRSESAKLGPDDPARLRKFVTWCGISTAAATIQPYRVEEFLAQQLNTSIPPRTYMSVLKAFFAYALKRGLIESDPMKVARLPRGAGSAKKAVAATGPSAAAQAAAAARQAQKQEDEVLYVSRDRLATMQADLERMRTEDRHRISRMLHEAIKDGDLSENAAYDDAKMQQGLLEARIREFESKLRNVELIEDQRPDAGAGVSVGSKVVLAEDGSGDQIEYTVVGPEEANPRGGKISNRSPVGRALLGKGAGDSVEVATPGGSVRYRIVSVA